MELIQLWSDLLKTKNIPHSMNFKLETELVHSVLLKRWIEAGLSDNEFAIQNAILFTYSSRTPLCIDPKEVAMNWIMSLKEVNSLKVLSYENQNFYEQLEVEKDTKYSVLIKDVDSIDPLLLKKIETERGVTYNFNFESQVEDFVMGKKYYFMTKNTHPNFDPDVYSLTTVINFSLSKMEIQERLLDFIFENEEKALWEQRKEIILNKFVKQNLLIELEDSLLLKVGKAEIGLLEHIYFIETLNKILIHIEEMKIKLIAELADLTQNNRQRNKYQPLSKSISILYLILSDLYMIDCMYEISIQLFFDILSYLWKNIIHKLGQNLQEEERINYLVQYMKKFFYDFQCRGMFARHRLLLSFMMAVQFDRSNELLTQEEINFFIHDSKMIFEPQQSPITWMSNEIWQKLNRLSFEFTEDFGDIINHITSNSQDWQKWFLLNQSRRVDLIYPYNKIKLFKKLMLLKCFEMANIYNIIEDYISEALGDEFLTKNNIKTEEIFLLGSCKRPIIFIMTPGTDPFADIMNLVTKHSMKNKVLKYSLGSSDKTLQRSMLFEAMSQGLWIVYQNCHLDMNFIIEIDKLLQSRIELHEEFRLWLITEYSHEFPSRVIRSSIKVTTETSENFKTKMEDIYTETAKDYLDLFNYSLFKPLLYALTLFHCIILERKKYGLLGWNKIYDFGSSDYYMAVRTIQEYLKISNYAGGNISWKAIKSLIGEITYGGHIIDKYDRRIILCYLDEIFGDFLSGSSRPFTFYKDKYVHCNILSDGNHGDYIDEIKKIPSVGMAKILGLHPNSDSKYYQDAVKIIWKNLSLIQYSKDSSSHSNKEDMVLMSLKNILGMLPSTFNINDIRSNSNISTIPTVTVLIHELQRMNSLIEKIFESSTNLINIITGKVNMNEEMENMFTCIYNNDLPIMWKSLAPETIQKLPSWISHIIQRVDEYKKWILLCPALPVIWLSGLHKPQSLFAALVQEASIKMEISLENLILVSNITCEYDPDNIQEPAEMGCYIKGLFIEGASWDSKNSCLKSLKTTISFEQLPVLMMQAAEKFHSKDQEIHKIPVYSTKLRNSSGSGLIFEAELKSLKHKSFSILMGVCILLNID